GIPRLHHRRHRPPSVPPPPPRPSRPPNHAPLLLMATEYYALVSPSRTRDDPDGLARCRFTPEGPVDESLRRDLTWGFTSAIYEREDGGAAGLSPYKNN